jgi:hypothetical protein
VSLVAAAVCPHPPLLVPEVAAGAAGELDDLRTACRAAVAHLTNASVDLLIVVGSDTETVRRDPPFGGTLRPWGIDEPVGDPAGDLPLSLLIGAWLVPGARNFQSVAATATPAECLRLGRALAGEAPRVGLLVLGDGSACRTDKAPGYFDPRAEAFDAAAATALAAADAEALAALDPALAAELLAVGRAPWQVLAGAVDDKADKLDGQLLYDDAPYGVAYLVAAWRER